MINKDN